MTKLSYTAIASLDGFIEDEHGNFDWAFPGPDVHAFVNQLERPVGLYLYGRRMYETMVLWETQGGTSAVTSEYAQILACSGQDRLLAHPAGGLQREDQDRA
jgi:dihydrofolate reductase